MGIWDWLFGRKSNDWTHAHAEGITSGSPQWQPSENGNPCLIYKNRRVTVFAADRGWKFCIAKIDYDNDPYFSEVYHTEDAAKFEALARMDGRPSRHSTRAHDSAAIRKGKWEEQIAERVKLYQELSSALAGATTVTDLRKIERKVESHIKQSSWQITQYYREGVSGRLIGQAEEMERSFKAMAPMVASRIAELKSRPRKNASPSQSEEEQQGPPTIES